MAPRTYDLGARRGASEGTRTRILEAARALVGGKGDLADFSMEAVAVKAGVSRMTVYNQFESRGGLLDALADHLAAKGGMHRLREVFGEEDAEQAVRRFVEVFVGFWASDRPTLRRMRALGVIYPSLHRGLPARDVWRLEAAANLIARHADRLGLSSSLAQRSAAELLSALTGFDFFDALATRERTPAQVSLWIRSVALATMRLGVDARSPGPTSRSRRANPRGPATGLPRVIDGRRGAPPRR